MYSYYRIQFNVIPLTCNVDKHQMGVNMSVKSMSQFNYCFNVYLLCQTNKVSILTFALVKDSKRFLHYDNLVCKQFVTLTWLNYCSHFKARARQKMSLNGYYILAITKLLYFEKRKIQNCVSCYLIDV